MFTFENGNKIAEDIDLNTLARQLKGVQVNFFPSSAHIFKSSN
jgi:hypothetical protein